MKRSSLLESFHGEGDGLVEGIDAALAKSNEELTVEVHGGTLSFLTRSGETDEEAIRQARFVRGDLKMENGQTFSFWLTAEGRGGIGDITIYPRGR